METLRERRHGDALVGAISVVGLNPGVEFALRDVNRGEDTSSEELLAQRPVKAFKLARRRWRERGRQEVVDLVVATYSVEQHFSGREAETIGEDLAVVGENLFGRAVVLEGARQVTAHLAADRAS